MLKHYLQITLRNFRRYRTTFLINLAGLSTGLAAALLIYCWIAGELRVDRYHTNNERLFQVMANTRVEGRVNTTTNTGGGLGAVLQAEMPEVEQAVSMTPPGWFQQFNLIHEGKVVGAAGNFAGSHYFDVFSYDFLEGRPAGALADKNAIVLSRSLAEKLFGSAANAVGQTLEWKWLSLGKPCTVTGVYADPPAHSTQPFELLLPLDVWKELMPASGDYRSGPFQTFLLLKPGVDAMQFNQKLGTFLSDKDKTITTQLFVRKFADGYLYGDYENGVQHGGRVEYVRLFALIAVFVLIIACINFMNLSTAKASRRMKEIGVKKAMGADKQKLILQFLGEAMLTSFLALLIALAMVAVLLPHFSTIVGKPVEVVPDARSIVAVLGITAGVGLLAGSYPAFYLSRFKVASALRGRSGGGPGEAWVRKGLVAFQFTISIVFIVAAMVMYQQLQFVQNKPAGYQKDHVVYFEMEGRAAENTDAFLSQLKAIPGVENASSIQQNIILPTATPGPGVQWEGKNADDKVRFHKMPVNFDALETLGIRMAAGRTFSRSFGTDSTAVVLNQAAVNAMGISHPVGKTITFNGQPRTIIGVTRDFHFNSLHESVQPFLFWLDPKATALIVVKVHPQGREATFRRITDFYGRFNPGYALHLQYLDDAYRRQYALEQLVTTLAQYFTWLTILISCLGLLGLAAFNVERRMKEIGVRKVLGASEANIFYVLSIEFTKIIGVAILLALPIGFLLTKNWLDGFAYRIVLAPLYFIAAACLALIAAWITIGIQTARAAALHPLQCLREE